MPNSMLSWGIAGMAFWGSTCGIAVACAQTIEIGTNRTGTPPIPNVRIDQVFAHYAEDVHPYPDVSNAPWFLDHPARWAFSRRPVVNPLKPGSLQCHNVVNMYRTRTQYTQLEPWNLADCRSEMCGRLVADLVYRTLTHINHVRNNFAMTAAESTAFNARRVGCTDNNCHSALYTGALPGAATGTFVPREDCLVCHR